MRWYFVELKGHFLAYSFDWLSYTPVLLMERVVTRCQGSPEQWTNVTNTFAALILFELQDSVAHFTLHPMWLALKQPEYCPLMRVQHSQ